MGDEMNARVAELAARLFELRAAQEADLRALTWIQQSLEGVRTGNTRGDADLLLSEMARRFSEADAATAAIAMQRQTALALLGGLIGRRRIVAA